MQRVRRSRRTSPTWFAWKSSDISAPVAVLVDRKGKILQFHGQTDRFLKLPAPGPDFNVFELARERLSSQLRLAIRKAVQDGKAVVLNSVPFLGESGPAFARVTTLPVAQKTHAEGLLVVFFEDASPPPAGGAEVIQSPENETIIKRLEEELNATRQDLQATIQELQSSNEELRAANEEVTSTNEELESTNEELVSSSEELQSTNEELTATVSQLQEKVELLDKAQDSLRRSEQRFRVLVESSPNAVLLTAGWNDHAPEPPGRGYVRLRAGRTDRPGGRVAYAQAIPKGTPLTLRGVRRPSKAAPMARGGTCSRCAGTAPSSPPRSA